MVWAGAILKCADCQRELEIGDQYIEATASEYLGSQGEESKSELDGLVAMVMGSGHGDKIVYCEDCTEKGGDFRLNTYYGDEE